MKGLKQILSFVTKALQSCACEGIYYAAFFHHKDRQFLSQSSANNTFDYADQRRKQEIIREGNFHQNVERYCREIKEVN
jgi:hypothetical protein